MPPTNDRYLQRFKDAQRQKADGIEAAIREVENGKKEGHWAFHLLPQYKGLGKSDTSNKFAIDSMDEAKAYLADTELCGNSKRLITALMQAKAENPAALDQIFADSRKSENGPPIDKLKLQASLTLLAAASPSSDQFFRHALFTLFGDRPVHEETQELLKQDGFVFDLTNPKKLSRRASATSPNGSLPFKVEVTSGFGQNDIKIQTMNGEPFYGSVFRMIERIGNFEIFKGKKEDDVAKSMERIAAVAFRVYQRNKALIERGSDSKRLVDKRIDDAVDEAMTALLAGIDPKTVLDKFEEAYEALLKQLQTRLPRERYDSQMPLNSSSVVPAFEPITSHPDTIAACDEFMNEKNRIFVFGSNLEGQHGGGAAGRAAKDFGAVWNRPVGRQGNSYAIPTLNKPSGALPTDQNQLELSEIARHAKEFIEYAKANPHLTFFVTRVGCGLGGFSDEQMAKLYLHAPSNCSMPEPWRDIIEKEREAISKLQDISSAPFTVSGTPVKNLNVPWSSSANAEAPPPPSSNASLTPSLTMGMSGGNPALSRTYPNGFEDKYRRGERGEFYRKDVVSAVPAFVEKKEKIHVMDDSDDVIKDLVQLSRYRGVQRMVVEGDITEEIAESYWRHTQLQGIDVAIFMDGKKWEPSAELQRQIDSERKAMMAMNSPPPFSMIRDSSAISPLPLPLDSRARPFSDSGAASAPAPTLRSIRPPLPKVEKLPPLTLSPPDAKLVEGRCSVEGDDAEKFKAAVEARNKRYKKLQQESPGTAPAILERERSKISIILLMEQILIDVFKERKEYANLQGVRSVEALKDRTDISGEVAYIHPMSGNAYVLLDPPPEGAKHFQARIGVVSRAQQIAMGVNLQRGDITRNSGLLAGVEPGRELVKREKQDTARSNSGRGRK